MSLSLHFSSFQSLPSNLCSPPLPASSRLFPPLRLTSSFFPPLLSNPFPPTSKQSFHLSLTSSFFSPLLSSPLLSLLIQNNLPSFPPSSLPFFLNSFLQSFQSPFYIPPLSSLFVIYSFLPFSHFLFSSPHSPTPSNGPFFTHWELNPFFHSISHHFSISLHLRHFFSISKSDRGSVSSASIFKYRC